MDVVHTGTIKCTKRLPSISKKKKSPVKCPLNLDCLICTQRQHKENASVITLALDSQIPSVSAHRHTAVRDGLCPRVTRVRELESGAGCCWLYWELIKYKEIYLQKPRGSLTAQRILNSYRDINNSKDSNNTTQTDSRSLCGTRCHHFLSPVSIYSFDGLQNHFLQLSTHPQETNRPFFTR